MIDLKPFCSTDPVYSYLHAPWSRGDFTYATNGHIIVRVRRRHRIKDRDDAPDVAKIFERLSSDVTYRPLKRIRFGRDWRTIKAVKLRQSCFQRCYLQLLMKLPKIELPVRADKRECMPFRFAGGDGGLMPFSARDGYDFDAGDA